MRDDTRTLTIRLERDFSDRDVERISSAVQEASCFESVTLDFTDVHHVDSAALAALSRTLRSTGQLKVSFRGLTNHQHKMLKYLGFSDERTS